MAGHHDADVHTVLSSSSTNAPHSVSVQTDLTLEEVDKLEVTNGMWLNDASSVIQENDRLRQQTIELKLKLDAITFSKDFFLDADDKVKYYTGLSTWPVLNTLFNFLESAIGTKGHSVISRFQQLILTLIRLRLCLHFQDLAYRFGIHHTTASRIFTSVLHVMYERLSFLIFWPERETLRATLPVDFRKHCPTCTVIIDCFEIFIDRASDLLARAQTYSHYKSHNTVKYLIGITPQGSVSFISNGWGGRASDKHITENCGLLNKIIPGDTILADRGFDIKESIGMYCATVRMPTFTRGKKQLTGVEVEQTRSIANERVYWNVLCYCSNANFYLR